MADKNEMARILAEEYGITTMKELDAAIRKMKGLDISMFVSKPIRKENEKCQERKEKEEGLKCRRKANEFVWQYQHLY